MSIFAQHGYAKSQKVELGLRSGSINGVVLGPRDETPDAMKAFASSLRDEFSNTITILFDPQFYATTIMPAHVRHLALYGHYREGLTRRQLSTRSVISDHVGEALAFQAELPVDRMVSPTVLAFDFQDPWSQIALTLAEETISSHRAMPTAPPLLISLAFEDRALSNTQGVEEVLDIITAMPVQGFYLIAAASEDAYPAKSQEERLANLMYIVYVLSNRNGFEVVCGYSDLCGLLLHAVGASATCCGWYNSLRQFSMSRFEPATGGGQARTRYTSGRLLNSILINPELDAIYRRGALSRVLVGTQQDAVLRVNPLAAVWSLEQSTLHHWSAISGLANLVSSDDVSRNLDVIGTAIDQATQEYQTLVAEGIPFEAASGPRNLSVWRNAIASFRTRIDQ